MTWTAQLRAWLLENEIFFKTFGALSLTTASIVVSCGSCTVADASRETAVSQAKMAHDKEMPIIVGKVHLIKDPTTQTFDREQLTVRNENSVVLQARVDAFVLFALEYADNGKRRSVWIPVWNYFATTWVTASVRGEVATLEGVCREGNNARFADLYRGFLKSASDGPFTETTLKRFVRIQYQDVFGAKHDELHLVEPISGSSLMSQDEAVQIRETYERRLRSNNVDFCTTDIVALTAAAKRIIQEEPNAVR